MIGKVVIILTGAYIINMRKYMLPDVDLFIPNLGLLSNNSNKNVNITNAIINSVTIRFDDFSWILSFKPIDGITIPYYVKLPFSVFLSIPKIKSEIGKNIRVKPVVKLNIVIGYRIIIKNASFYA